MGRLLVPADVLTIALKNRKDVALNAPPQRLQGLRAEVHDDGEVANFTIHLTGHRPFWFYAGIEQIAAMEQEIRTAREMMVDIQLMGLDRGERVLQTLPRHAMTPIEVVAAVDPFTRDRLYTLHFTDKAPFTIRMTASAVLQCRADIAKAEARYGN